MTQVVDICLRGKYTYEQYVSLEDYKKLLSVARELFDYYPDSFWIADYHERTRRERRKEELEKLLFKENKI